VALLHVGAGARCVAALLVAMLLALPSPGARAAEFIPLPFVEGGGAIIIQGYNGGTHQGSSVYGLDLVLASGQTSGATVISPLEGTIGFAFEPGEKTGCVSVLGRDRRFGVMLCHVQLDRPYRRGERVNRGQPLGVVGGPGEVGNNGTPHVHLELLKDGRSGSPVPFGGPEGLPLEGVDLPATGVRGEHASRQVIVSTNALSGPPAPEPVSIARTNAAPARDALAQAARGCARGVAPGFVAGFAQLKSRLGDLMGNPLTCEYPDPNGTGDVHQMTTKGLAFWRKATNTPTFTNGSEHWGHTAGGWMYWRGESIDPPA
jgi:hypothetical protein